MSNDVGAGRERVETMADPKDRLDKMIHTLKEHRFRLTPQRLAVLKILAKSDGHPSVETIYERVKPDFPTTSLATIYKTPLWYQATSGNKMRDRNKVLLIP